MKGWLRLAVALSGLWLVVCLGNLVHDCVRIDLRERSRFPPSKSPFFRIDETVVTEPNAARVEHPSVGQVDFDAGMSRKQIEWVMSGAVQIARAKAGSKYSILLDAPNDKASNLEREKQLKETLARVTEEFKHLPPVGSPELDIQDPIVKELKWHEPHEAIVRYYTSVFEWWRLLAIAVAPAVVGSFALLLVVWSVRWVAAGFSGTPRFARHSGLTALSIALVVCAIIYALTHRYEFRTVSSPFGKGNTVQKYDRWTGNRAD